jgi:hypothetical protein
MGQNDTRKPEEPTTDPEPKAQDVNTQGVGLEQKDAGLKEPGPKPLSTVAREHGGDAGNRTTEGGAKGGDSSSVSSISSSDEEDEDSGVQKHSHGSGTGELYVKSSGLQADGGNFDASKPGAGREADRKQLRPKIRDIRGFFVS